MKSAEYIVFPSEEEEKEVELRWHIWQLSVTSSIEHCKCT